MSLCQGKIKALGSSWCIFMDHLLKFRLVMNGEWKGTYKLTKPVSVFYGQLIFLGIFNLNARKIPDVLTENLLSSARPMSQQEVIKEPRDIWDHVPVLSYDCFVYFELPSIFKLNLHRTGLRISEGKKSINISTLRRY